MSNVIEMSIEEYWELFGHPDSETPINDLGGESDETEPIDSVQPF